MVAIPLGVGSFSRDQSFQPEVTLKNMVVERDVSGAAEDSTARIQRPGLRLYQTIASGTAVRGLSYTSGLLFNKPVAVVADKIYSFDQSGVTLIASLANDGKQVQFAATNFCIATLSAGNLYLFNGVWTPVSIPESRVPVGIASLNSYLIIACSDGTWYWIEPGDDTIDPLHFATAESMPDGLIGVRTMRSEVYFFGANSMEVWQPTFDPDIILVRATGREWDRGAMAAETLLPLDNSMFVVGDDGIVYRVAGDPERVSNSGIEERIRKRTGPLTAFSYTFDGHAIYALNIPGVGTFCLDTLTAEWAEYSTTGIGWRPQVSCTYGTNVLCGDSTSGKVFVLDPALNTDDGIIFERSVSGAVAFHHGRQRNDNVSVHVGSNQPISIRMRFRDGLRAWSAYRTKVSSALTDIVDFWRLGAAKAPVRVVEFSCVVDAPLRISGAWANEARPN
ncbi:MULTISPECIES: hypothetical protein [Sphingomonas]|uniref:hypothetical protein n=1 Tax=Sphingomonas TaxID=13687 RepID=UPI000DEFAD6E|nr:MULTISPECIES: hypothetical protein [Sphingomonas]